jgi:hypothetical protein
MVFAHALEIEQLARSDLADEDWPPPIDSDEASTH